VVGLPPEDEPRPAGGVAPGWTAAQRGVVAHAVLERLDFLRAVPPSADAVSAAAARQDVPAPTPAEAEEIVALAQAFCASDLCTRLGRAAALAGPGGGRVAREQRFAFELEPGGVLVSGVFDVAVRLAGGLLVIDYKSDRLQGADPVEVVERQYVLQRLIYALAALESGAASVEVVHLFLERADAPVTAAFTASDRDRLRSQLLDAARGLLAHEFPVAAEPWHGICAGCSGAGGLCSWPVELTRREAPDRLF
jgi:ATP-dependent exoDNAse (exonuclease V) beta subunit